mmetsp:Transcript_2665/g.9319  ORF Transcript_2665/g.9319 Transcript_2665/m.9319 type:complete len:409 (-) Transcript_2665:76-1302(-)
MADLESLIAGTQESLGALITRPKLSEKLLGKPPFRFLHDVVTNVTGATGFGEGLYEEELLNAKAIKDKALKVEFLQRIIDLTNNQLGEEVDVRPSKIVAGLEPENTNMWLQALARAAVSFRDGGGPAGGGGKEDEGGKNDDNDAAEAEAAAAAEAAAREAEEAKREEAARRAAEEQAANAAAAAAQAEAERAAAAAERERAAKAAAAADARSNDDGGGGKSGGGGGGGGKKGGAADVGPAFAHLDIRVGRIVKAWPHPEADKLFVEEIDVGEGAPRQILSGLRPYYSADDLTGRTILVVCNLKPRKMVGLESHGMVLCANNADRSVVEFVAVPDGAQPGDRLVAAGLDTEGAVPDAAVNPAKKKNAWTSSVDGLRTREEDGVACWEGHELQVNGQPCRAPNVKGGAIA